MPRHYTDDEKRLVLDRLIANHGDITRTAAETGVSDRTLLRWRNENDIKSPSITVMATTTSTTSPTQTSSSSPSLRSGEGLGEGLPPETTEAFQTLHDKLLTLANTLSHRIEEAIDEAPLNQRVAALTQLIASIAKLASLLPQPEEEVIYVHEYEYGVAHHVEKIPSAQAKDRHDQASEDQTGD